MQDIKLNPEKTALVVIDMQKGIANLGRKLEPYAADTVIKNVKLLVDKFRDTGAKVFLVHVTGTDGKDMLKPIVDEQAAWASAPRAADWSDFVEDIKPTDNDIIITKRQWGAFYGTELDLQLRRREINTIVLCGISTNIGVETTAREAYQLGYNQIFAEDAMSAMTAEEHENTKKYIFVRIGLIRSTEQILNIF